MLSFGG